MITGAQIRAARELLGWTRYRLAPRAGMSHRLLAQFESGRAIDQESAARVKAALEDFPANDRGAGVRLRACNGAGVLFTNDDAPGVKLKAKGKRPK
jgi:transcriptional regulator with XRE-family HTH domain